MFASGLRKVVLDKLDGDVGYQSKIVAVFSGSLQALLGTLLLLVRGVADIWTIGLWVGASLAVAFGVWRIAKRFFVSPTLTAVDALEKAATDFDGNAPDLGSVNELTRLRQYAADCAVRTAEIKRNYDVSAGQLRHKKEGMDRLIQGFSRLEQTLKSTTEDASVLKLVGDEMKQDALNIVHISSSSSEVSAQGIEYVVLSKGAMGEIRESEQSIMMSNGKVTEYVDEINEIIVMVSEISAQSTLLAINASIQAAKAGKAGRGFSVVAREIRELSVNSKRATKRAARIIQNIRTAIDELQQHVEEGRVRTDRGTVMLDKTEETFSQLKGIISEISEVARIISASAKEQSYGLESIEDTITKLYGLSREHSVALEAHGGDRTEVETTETSMTD